MERGINTRCLHLEETEGKTDNYGALSYPIYQTASEKAPDTITADFRIRQESSLRRWLLF